MGLHPGAIIWVEKPFENKQIKIRKRVREQETPHSMKCFQSMFHQYRYTINRRANSWACLRGGLQTYQIFFSGQMGLYKDGLISGRTLIRNFTAVSCK